MPEFCAFGLEELTSRRRIEIQVVDFDDGAGIKCGGFDGRYLAAVRRDTPGMFVGLVSADETGARHRGDTCQRLATEPQAGDAFQVVQRGDLAGGMACEGKRQVVLRHTFAIIGHTKLLDAAV